MAKKKLQKENLNENEVVDVNNGKKGSFREIKFFLAGERKSPFRRREGLNIRWRCRNAGESESVPQKRTSLFSPAVRRPGPRDFP